MKLYCYSRKDFVNTMKENGWTNPRAYELVPVAFYTKDGEVK